MLYVKIIRSIYGCIEAAILWYDLYSSKLKDLGFKVNPYDSCVANCDIEGSQCTIVWYVDDNKISHAEEEVITNHIQILEKYFGKFTITRGKTHSYLGMDVTLKNDGLIEIDMSKHLSKILEDLVRT